MNKVFVSHSHWSADHQWPTSLYRSLARLLDPFGTLVAVYVPFGSTAEPDEWQLVADDLKAAMEEVEVELPTEPHDQELVQAR